VDSRLKTVRSDLAESARGGPITGSSSGPLDPRQINAALGQTVTDLQALRNQVQQLGRTGNAPNAAGDIQNALTAAQAGQRRFTGDPSEIEKIAKEILEPLREAELELSKRLEVLVEKDKIRAAMEDEAPAGFEKETKAYFEVVGKGK
jgi:hypothetical protein